MSLAAFPVTAETIDLGYRPRAQFTAYHKRKQRWACIVAHRRAGKTVACIMDIIDDALRCTKQDGRFAYIAPTYAQAKDVVWMYLKRYTQGLPGVEHRESDLIVNLPNSSRIRLYGADNYDRMRGVYFDGAVLDEPANMDPRAWPEVIRPALSDREGWATFIGTPKGRNQFWEIHDNAQKDPNWYSLVLKASESGIIPQSELDSARETMSEEQYRQEFECDFEAAVVGAYYGKLMAQADQDKRIAGVPYEPTAQVWTAWDLGISDATAIWFAQVVGRETRIIDYYEASGVDLGHYVREIKSKPYMFGGHIVPHDAQAKELGTGKSRLEVLESLGLRNLQVAPIHRVEDGINAVRVMLPKCWFDAVKCQRGIDALKLYRSEWDDRLQTLKPRPVHDWASHAADAFRYLAMTLDTRVAMNSFNRKLELPRMSVA